MIQIYKKNNTNFDFNGDMTLLPVSCELEVKLNETWKLQLVHPLDEEGRWKYIDEEAVICAPTFQGKRQLFRINDLEKTDTEITATAYPIFFDSAKDCFLMDIRPEMKSGQQALDILMAGTKYSGKSDINTGSTAYFVRRNLMDAINGQDEPTFIQRWGGEILYDNFKVIINKRVGGDYGTEIRYGKNMDGLSYHLDMTDVVTRIVPVSYNGHTLPGASPWVDSKNFKKYATAYTKEIKFENVKLAEDVEGEVGEEDIICETLESLHETLREKCREQYELGADLPAVTIEINMIDLSRTEEYKEFKILETVGLGDTVHCRHSQLDITTDARVIELVWDCIWDIPVSVKLGDFDYNYFSELTSTLNAVKKIVGPGNTVIAERVSGVLNAVNTQLRYQKNIAQRQDVRAILFEDTMTDSPTYGAMCIGTQGFQIADRKTEDGRAWDWTTAFTAKGGYADVLVAGLLSDKTGRSFWNLDTGEMQMTGVFRQFDTKGYKSVDIFNNQVRFFAWNDNGNYVGSVGSIKRISDGRIGIEMWCDKGDMLWLGYDDGTASGGRIKPILSFDSADLSKTPWIINTATGKLFPNNPNGGITIENGFAKEWHLKAANGYVETSGWRLDITDGLITAITGK